MLSFVVLRCVTLLFVEVLFYDHFPHSDLVLIASSLSSDILSGYPNKSGVAYKLSQAPPWYVYNPAREPGKNKYLLQYSENISSRDGIFCQDCYFFTASLLVQLDCGHTGNNMKNMPRLISGSSSPFSRKVRIALEEKEIPFELLTEVPWDHTTQTPQYNPLSKVPVLILNNGKSIYESHYILEYIEAKFPNSPRLLPREPDRIDDLLFAKQVEVVADGICEAILLSFVEKQRGEGKISEEWLTRQGKKIDGGLKALADWVGVKETSKYLVGDSFGLADLAVGAALGYMRIRFPDHPWRETYPLLDKYGEWLEERQSFKNTTAVPQKINDKIV